MDTDDLSVMEQEMPEQLVRALSCITESSAMSRFLRDVMTEKEITEIGARFEAAKMLRAGASYTEIINRTRLSSRTVARISDWLQNGTGGYAVALETLEHLHTRPDSSV